MKKSDFYYDLPPELIAQDPLSVRSSSRLLHVPLDGGDFTHHVFDEITSFLKKGDCLVLNDTKVIPARLLGARKETGGAVELLLLKRLSDTKWETLVRPGKKCREGARLVFGDGKLNAHIDEVLPDGNRTVIFEFDGIWEEVLDELTGGGEETDE